MTHICNKCGNYESFSGTATYSVTGTRTWNVRFDGEGCIDEDIEETDSEIEDGDMEEDSIEDCYDCGSSNIEWLDDDDFETWKETHFDSEGNFHITKVTQSIDARGNLI